MEFMKLMERSLSGHVVGLILSVGVACYGGNAMADVTEDYDQGAKFYAAGDFVSAMPPLRKAADAGHADAQAKLAEILYQSGFDEEASQYFRKSAEQKNDYAQLRLGTMYMEGHGVKASPQEARKWLLLAADQGNKSAIDLVASAYVSGGLGLTEEERKAADALRWIKAAADNGYLPAMETLAAAYRSGVYGLEADTKIADQWAEKVKKIKGPSKSRRGSTTTLGGKK